MGEGQLFNELRNTLRVRGARIHCTGQIAAFRRAQATELVPCHSEVRGAQDGGGGASLRCHGAEWEGGNFSTHAAKLYA